jgi:cysteine desulfurase
MPAIYLDHQAATPLLPEAAEAMRPFWTETYGSLSSLHRLGLKSRDAVQQAREQIASFLHAAHSEEIIFTGNGTEAANLAIKGLAEARRPASGHVVLSAVEHPAVMESAAALEKNGWRASRIRVDSEGRINPEAVLAACTEETSLIAIHLGNYDLGTLQPVAEICSRAAAKNIPVFCDANFAAGWEPIDVQALGVSLLSFSPHRLYGPKGVGVLYRNRRVKISPLIQGGVQENGFRAGTENVPVIVGAGVACEMARGAFPQRISHVRALAQKLYAGLQARIPRTHLNGPPPGPERLPHHLSLRFDGVEGEALVLLADLKGVVLGAGTACVTKNLRVPHTLAALGLTPAQAQGTLLATLGKDNTEAEIDQIIDLLPSLVEKLRAMSPLENEP